MSPRIGVFCELGLGFTTYAESVSYGYALSESTDINVRFTEMRLQMGLTYGR